MTTSDPPTIFQTSFDVPLTQDSGSTISLAQFDTSSLDQSRLSRLNSIQLKTTSRDQWQKNQGPQVFSWFELSIYRAWELSKPRANLATGGELIWRSHSNRSKNNEEGETLEGRIFTQDDDLLKELQAGDIIKARWCTQPPVDSNHGVKGELIMTFLDESIDPDTSRRTHFYPSDGPCLVESWDHNVQSKIWFSTPALDQSTISRLAQIQLFTESRDQCFVTDKESASYSWFDVVVLSAPGDQTPRIKDGLELAWRSHTNVVDSQGLKILDGSIFDIKHTIFRAIAPGNCIAVRLSSRFTAWENFANDGCLELRFAPTDIKRKPVKPPTELTEAADKNRKLIEALLSLYTQMNGVNREQVSIKGGMELSTLVRDILNEPMRWDQTHGYKEPELMLLSLDGGGVRGLASLYVLKAIMEQVKIDRGLEETPKPCDIFDLIGGTSTGGLIAIMLARLRMSVQDCITAYEQLAQDVFGKGVKEKYDSIWSGWLAKGEAFLESVKKHVGVAADTFMYDEKKLEDAIKRVIKDKGGDPDSMMFSDQGCRARADSSFLSVVFACRTDNINNIAATHFRTYPLKDDFMAHRCKIWQAARATSAAPVYFRRIEIDNYQYVDGGLQVNNPVIQTIAESMTVFGKARPVGCLISLGTGMPPNQTLEDNAGLFGNIKSWASLASTILSQMTNAQRAHLDVEALNQHGKLAQGYYRFNPDLGVVGPSQDSQWESKLIGLDDTTAMLHFQEYTERYLGDVKINEGVKECAKLLAVKLACMRLSTSIQHRWRQRVLHMSHTATEPGQLQAGVDYRVFTTGTTSAKPPVALDIGASQSSVALQNATGAGWGHSAAL
ncbi:FabD/lysophospholipase-like protein [Ceratobasidium sp. AG-I]|nr:FabD/lysophospholipase-like protein [Ceratobasidium sp. AG-I]